MTTTITIPGAVYYDALDPACSGMAAEIGLPAPRRVKRGFGYTFVYDGVTPEQAEEVAEYIGDRAETLLGQDEEGSTHRAAIKAAARIREQLADAR